MVEQKKNGNIKIPYSLLVWIITVIFIAGGVVASVKYLNLRVDKVEASQKEGSTKFNKFQLDISNELTKITAKLENIEGKL